MTELWLRDEVTHPVINQYMENWRAGTQPVLLNPNSMLLLPPALHTTVYVVLSRKKRSWDQLTLLPWLRVTEISSLVHSLFSFASFPLLVWDLTSLGPCSGSASCMVCYIALLEPFLDKTMPQAELSPSWPSWKISSSSLVLLLYSLLQIRKPRLSPPLSFTLSLMFSFLLAQRC